MKKQNVMKPSSKKIAAIINAMLVFLVVCVGTLCFAPQQNSVNVDGEHTALYRSGNVKSGGVSLLINVYWGSEEVVEMLEILDKYQAKATFFIGACWADDNVDCLRAIYNAGHEIGNHGYFHKDHKKLSFEANKQEIQTCNQFILQAIGVQPTLFAPPSGAYSDNTLAAAQQLNMKTILWSRDTIDWRDKDSALIYTRATKNIQSGDFVLMHPMQATVDALEDILKNYKSRNLSVISVTENLRERG